MVDLFTLGIKREKTNGFNPGFNGENYIADG